MRLLCWVRLRWCAWLRGCRCFRESALPFLGTAFSTSNRRSVAERGWTYWQSASFKNGFGRLALVNFVVERDPLTPMVI
jgi:hypothetical protein